MPEPATGDTVVDMKIDVHICKTQAHPGQIAGPCTRVDIEFASEHRRHLEAILGPELGAHVVACDEGAIVLGRGGSTHFHPHLEGERLRMVMRQEQGHPYLGKIGTSFAKTERLGGATLDFDNCQIVLSLPSPDRRRRPMQFVGRDGSTRAGATSHELFGSAAVHIERPLDLRDPADYRVRVQQVGCEQARAELRALRSPPEPVVQPTPPAPAEELFSFSEAELLAGAARADEPPQPILYEGGDACIPADHLRRVLAGLPSETQETIGAWLRSTPMWPTTTDFAIVARAQREMAELITLFAHRPRLDSEELNEWFDKVVAECADVIIVLYGLPNVMGFDLHKAVDAKMQINRKRKWVKTAAGDHHHAEESKT